MTFDTTRILESKRAFRRQLAARPIAEKLAMLDTLREMVVTIRHAGKPKTESTVVLHEEPAPYRTSKKGGKAS